MRDERFGYVKLATDGYAPPWKDFARDLDTPSPPRFIETWKENGITRVRFAVELTFDMATGKLDDVDRRCLMGERRAQWQ